MRTDTKIARVADAVDRAAYWSGVGQPGKARGILKEARDLAGQARAELEVDGRRLADGLLAINAALADLDAKR